MHSDGENFHSNWSVRLNDNNNNITKSHIMSRYYFLLYQHKCRTGGLVVNISVCVLFLYEKSKSIYGL